jgi:hypothetical protein
MAQVILPLPSPWETNRNWFHNLTGGEKQASRSLNCETGEWFVRECGWLDPFRRPLAATSTSADCVTASLTFSVGGTGYLVSMTQMLS